MFSPAPELQKHDFNQSARVFSWDCFLNVIVIVDAVVVVVATAVIIVLLLSLLLFHSRPQRPRSFWSALKNRDLWPGPTSEVPDSRDSRHSAHVQSQV